MVILEDGHPRQEIILNGKKTASNYEMLHFTRETDVGEFKIKNIYSGVHLSNRSVSLYIELAPFYSYHLLNNFLTSFLIVLISIGTFFFRVDFFNERIMVSLTALLVLTGLFTQANSTSFNTSYIKLFDIWYAWLIICTFLTVGINTAIHSYHQKLKSALSFKEEDDETLLHKVNKMNKILFAVLVGILSLFLVYFGLSAADVI